jgi:hypothetical protein
MSKHFEVGDHVCWNSEAGHVSGRIIKIHTHDTSGLVALSPGTHRGCVVRAGHQGGAYHR